MHVTSKNDINSSTIEKFLHGSLHVVRLGLILMGSIRVVPRRVDNNHQPRSLFSIDLPQVGLQPLVLGGVLVKISVGPKHDDVDTTRGGVEGVVEVGVGGALVEGHGPASVVGGEGGVVDGGDLLVLMIALGDHPWALAREWLHQAAEGVPPGLDDVRVGQVARQYQNVVV